MLKIQSLEDFVHAVRERPDMFVRDYSLAELQSMLHGYSVALQVHDITELGRDFNRRFSGFLERKYKAQHWSLSIGWARAITEHCESAEAAFHRFFELFEEFRKTTRPGAG